MCSVSLRKSIALLFIVVLLHTPISATIAKTDNFLIIERPQALTIFNQFQRSMTDAEKAALGPFMPLQIVNDKTDLGDDITPVLKGKANGNIYFLLQDGERRIINRINAGLVKRFSRCTVLGDTVRITQNGVRFFSPRSPGLNTIRKLEKGHTLQLIFQKRRYIYARLLTNETVYGWLAASDTRRWKKLAKRPTVAAPALPALLRERIINRFNEANRKYSLLFTYFEQSGYAARPLPQWRQETMREKLIFRIEPPEAIHNLQRSTQILLHDVQGDLIGSGWQARYEGGQIIIEAQNK